MQAASKLSIPTYLICGDTDTPDSSHFTEILTLASLEPDIAKSISKPAPLVTQLGAKIAKLIK